MERTVAISGRYMTGNGDSSSSHRGLRFYPGTRLRRSRDQDRGQRVHLKLDGHTMTGS